MIPVFEGSSYSIGHWTQVMVDVANRTIRDAETEEVKEKRYGEEVLDYLEDQWRRTKVGKFVRSDWRCLSRKTVLLHSKKIS